MMVCALSLKASITHPRSHVCSSLTHGDAVQGRYPNGIARKDSMEYTQMSTNATYLQQQEGPSMDGVSDSQGLAEGSATSTQGSEQRFAIARSGPWFTAFKDLVALREKVSTRRIGLEIQESNYKAQWRHTSHHLDNFLQTASTFMSTIAEPNVATTTHSINDTWVHLQESVEHLQNWQKQGRHFQKELTKLEGMLKVKEDAVYNELRHAFAPSVSASSVSEGAGPPPNFDSFSESSIETNPFEHDYYDKVGDLHLLRERIYNFDADQKRRNLEKEHALAHGEYAPQIHERHSYEDYIRQREQLVKEYLTKKQEMEVLRDRCLQNGFEVNLPDLPPILDLSRANERPVMMEPDDFLKISTKWNPDRYLMFGGLDKRNRILLWRSKVNNAEAEVVEQKSHRAHADEAVSPKATLGLARRIEAMDVPIISSEHSPTHRSDQAAQSDLQDGGLELKFDAVQEVDPNSRRYSEPDISDRRRMMVTFQSLMGYTTARSDGAVERY